MEKEFSAFVGIDISKAKLDSCLVFQKQKQQFHEVFPNTGKGIEALLAWTVTHSELPLDEVLFCMEHTGLYAMPLWYLLGKGNYHFVLTGSLEVLQSMGIKRGKTDRTDAKAIALYAKTRACTLTECKPVEEKLVRLRFLLAHRSRLLKAKKMFEVTTLEMKGFVPIAIDPSIGLHSKQLIAGLRKKIKDTEAQIVRLISADMELSQMNKLLQSVPGVGPQVAAFLLVYTHGFTSFSNARKFACYAGVAPFAYQSGSSIRGKTRVSHLANKPMKALLNLAALAAKKKDLQIRNYYEQKIKEGKNPMLIINNIRNKLLARIFATVKRGTPYVFTMQYAH